MARPANRGHITWDNAVVEAFWGRLQVEVLNRQRWNTRLELASAIFEWIEGFYNRRRRHSALDWASPIEFEMPRAINRVNNSRSAVCGAGPGRP